MGATPCSVAWMGCGDATTTKLTQDIMWDVMYKDAMPYAWIRVHGCNVMTRCTKGGWDVACARVATGRDVGFRHKQRMVMTLAKVGNHGQGAKM